MREAPATTGAKRRQGQTLGSQDGLSYVVVKVEKAGPQTEKGKFRESSQDL